MRRSNHKRARRLLTVLALLIVTGIALMSFLKSRWLGNLEMLLLEETTQDLENPDRGFYLIHGFVLADQMDVEALVQEKFGGEQGHSLALLELNLRNYRTGPISDAGLKNLKDLFEALRTVNRRFIVRFLYDWDGKNLETEPVSRSIVENHMAQVGPILNENVSQIYTLQGLFVGNWGEMNGTRYTGTEHWQALAGKLEAVTDDSLFLSVRMPMQWRRINPQEDAETRMGLFNDGMLGSDSDLGTYGSKARTDTSYADLWSRSDELAFQEILCRRVPNGGEVVWNQKVPDLEQAIDYLETLHVSYLNEDYDRRVLSAWAGETVNEGPWQGIDGLRYIQAHLGYRYVAENPVLTYSWFSNTLHVAVDLKNVGFAPAYFPISPTLVCSGGRETKTFPLEGDISALWGGSHTNAVTLQADIPLEALERGNWQLLLRLDSDLGEILLANTGRQPQGGYLIGGMTEK